MNPTKDIELSFDGMRNATTDGLLEQMKSDSRRITSVTPLTSNCWDDPEEWTIEAVRLAHVVAELTKRNVL